MSEELIKDLFTYGAAFVCGYITGGVVIPILMGRANKDEEGK